MKRISPFAASLAAAVALASAPAYAQYATEFVPAKLIKQGVTSVPIAGTGIVVVQVQINPDGSHKATKVIRSTNQGDNAAALSIAQASTYRPAHRGTTPVAAFYDFTLKFNGKSVATSADESSGSGGAAAGGLSPAAAAVGALIHQKNYAAAKAKAQSELATSPNDQSLKQMLGVASYDSGDVTGAAQAFDGVTSIGTQFRPAAAASFAAAAVMQADQNPSQAVAYATKAVSLQPDSDSRFALGTAQLAAGQNAAALATLESVHASAMHDSKLSNAAKVNIDARLMAAYSANNDTAGAAKIAAEIKQLNPNSTLPGRVLGNGYLKAGVTAADAKNYDEAFKNFDLAAAQGDPEVAVTADTEAAFLSAKLAKPDYKQMQAYAEKALAAKPNDPQAMYALGIAQTGEWSQSHDDSMKKKALDTLTQADTLAKAAGNQQLALAIEAFIKNSLPQTSGT
jgi:tetratricopeptide (TPR) repeat protein